jgi:hypothetical protein
LIAIKIVSEAIFYMTSSSAQAVGRLQQVRPQTQWRESLAVLLAIVVIITLMALRFLLLPSDKTEITLKSYQQLIHTLELQDQVVYRSLFSSVAEVVHMADQLGQWPEATLLEEAEIPPFALGYLPAPVDDFIWIGYDGGTWVDYLGHDRSGRSTVSYILRLIDLHGGYHPHPHPGVDYDPELTVAIQIWRYAETQRPYPGERLPEAGWTWIIEENNLLQAVSGEAGVAG